MHITYEVTSYPSPKLNGREERLIAKSITSWIAQAKQRLQGYYLWKDQNPKLYATLALVVKRNDGSLAAVLKVSDHYQDVYFPVYVDSTNGEITPNFYRAAYLIKDQPSTQRS